jgi:large subunit ribosomal protein L13
MGRVATQIAIWLRGKHKRDYTPNMDMGDFVVAINTNHLKFSGRKTEQKVYFRHSGYLGGIKSEKLNVVLQKDPSEALRRAVFSMLDDVKFRKAMMARLKLVGNSEHNYQV